MRSMLMLRWTLQPKEENVATRKKAQEAEAVDWGHGGYVLISLSQALKAAQRMEKILTSAVDDLEYGRQEAMTPEELEAFAVVLKLSVSRAAKFADDFYGEIQKAKAQQVMAFCT